MRKEKETKKPISEEEIGQHDFETKKREAYSAMGKLGGGRSCKAAR